MGNLGTGVFPAGAIAKVEVENQNRLILFSGKNREKLSLKE